MSRTEQLEREDVAVLRLLAEGRTLCAIGRELGMSDRTVRRHMRRLCDEIGVATPIEAVVWAVRRGYL